MADIILAEAQVNKKTSLKTLKLNEEKAAYTFILWMFYLKLRTTVSCFASFMYGILTLHTKPALQLTRSEDSSFSISIKTDNFLRMKIVLHIPDSIQLSYLSTDNSYRFELKGSVNSSIKSGCMTGNTNKNSIQDSLQTILEKLLPGINGMNTSGNFKDDINHSQADRNNDVKKSGSLSYTESTYENEETIFIDTTESTENNGKTNDVKAINDCSGDYHQKTEKGDSRCLNENNVPETSATDAQRARKYDVNRTINTVTVDHRDGNGMKNNDDEHGNEHNFKTAKHNSAVHFNDSLFKPTETYTLFSMHSVERRKIKTSRIKTVKNLDREGKIRRHTGEYFLSKQAQVESHVLWPSMHPLLPYTERRLEKR